MCQGPPFQLKGPLALFAICYFVPRKKKSKLIDSGLVGRKVFFNHHIHPVVSGAQTHRTHNRPQQLQI